MINPEIGVVFCANVQWDSAWERLHQFARMFGAERKTIYVNNAGLQQADLNQSLSGLFAGLHQGGSQNPFHPSGASVNGGDVTVCSPLLLPGGNDAGSEKLNAQIFTRQVLGAMQKAGMNRAILWAASPQPTWCTWLHRVPGIW